MGRKNVIVDEKGDIKVIIDWGEAGYHMAVLQSASVFLQCN